MEELIEDKFNTPLAALQKLYNMNDLYSSGFALPL